MMYVKFILPSMGGHQFRAVPAVPNRGDQVRYYDGPLGSGPALYWVENIIWDVPSTDGFSSDRDPSVEVWLTTDRPKNAAR